jgi:dTDP-4-dehydrorhamnose reductase
MSQERVFVLGHRGMLGHLAGRYLQEQGCEIMTSQLRYTGLPHDPLLRAVRDSGCRWVINAIGLIKQKSDDPVQLYQLNSILPIHLALQLGPEQRLIHASTDCVFSGRRGWHAADETRDADDVYGFSKALGEQVALDPRAVVMRVSIIGPDLGTGTGLLAWFLKQQGSIRGYTNHFWNGITTLEWAKAAWEIICGTAPRTSGLIQLGVSDRSSKYEMLALFKEIWSQDTVIEPAAPAEAADRTLQPDWLRKPLREQLLELKNWMDSTPCYMSS